MNAMLNVICTSMIPMLHVIRTSMIPKLNVICTSMILMIPTNPLLLA